jgi:hypothetical protein
MKVIIIEILYFQLRMFNGNIGYIKNIALTNVEWIQKQITMHPTINILINFNDFIKKHVNLQNITFENLPTNVIPMVLYQKASNIITKY